VNAVRPEVIIPLLAVYLSVQLSLLFATISLSGLSRRPEYAALSIFSLFLAVMMFCTFWYQEAQGRTSSEHALHASLALLGRGCNSWAGTAQ